MRLGRGRSPSVSDGLSAAAGGGASGGGVDGFESVGGGGGGGGDDDAKSDDGGATCIKPMEDDSVVEAPLLPFFLRGSACAEEAASTATSETMPMIFSDVTIGDSTLWTPLRRGSLGRIRNDASSPSTRFERHIVIVEKFNPRGRGQRDTQIPAGRGNQAMTPCALRSELRICV